MEKKIEIPKHIAIIMDGNGRWAKEKNKPRVFGHKAGAEALRKIVTYSKKIGVKYLTVYAFSTENWKRSKEEVEALMLLFKAYISSERKALLKNKIRFVVSGRKEGVSDSLLKAIDSLEKVTSKDYEMTLNIAFNYGGRAEIIDAFNKATILGEKITEENFNKFLVDKMNIRLNDSGGIIKVSNDGLLLQSSSVANQIMAGFSNNETKLISGSYVEFAERKILPKYLAIDIKNIETKHRRDGFEASNADKIFESTFTTQTL
ncbi:MAG: polyprenyl diphosphate synthase, partial [Fusobacterium sp.]